MAISEAQQRNVLKKLREQDYVPFQQLLSSTADLAVFDLVREHKMLLVAKERSTLFTTYESCASRLLQGEALKRELDYITFLSHYLTATTALHKRAQVLLHKFSGLALNEFIFLLTQAVESHAADMLTNMFSKLEPLLTSELSVELRSSINEVAHNKLRANLIDIFTAVGNATNLFALKADSADKNGRQDQYADGDVVGLITIVSNINSYDYVLDMLSYGEWYIENIDRTINAGKTTFELAIIDALRQKARALGLKRMTSGLFIKKKNQRFIRQFIKQFSDRVLKDAWAFYQDHYDVLFSNQHLYLETLKTVEQSYEEIDAEDDLLAAMDPLEVHSTFLTAFVLNVYAIAAKAVLTKVKNPRRKAAGIEIPVREIDVFFTKFLWHNHKLDNKCELFIGILPMRHYMGIFDTPFIRIGDSVYFFDHIGSHGWASRVRSCFMKGGRTADLVGKVWEQFIADTLTQQRCGKVVSGFKLKNHGKILTDVDLLFKIGDTLFITQLKIYYGTGNTIFEQWKFRKKLEHGVMQVKKSQTAIMENPSILLSKFSEKECLEIKRFRTVVMTNADIFNGWIFQGVTIMTNSSLMQIINGSNVKFTNISGEVISEKKYGSDGMMTPDEFCSFIEFPLDWRIGQPELQIIKHREEFDYDVIYFPHLEDQKAIIS